jgi:hypothetical protein
MSAFSCRDRKQPTIGSEIEQTGNVEWRWWKSCPIKAEGAVEAGEGNYYDL